MVIKTALKVCLACNRDYKGLELDHCPNDGTSLIWLRQEYEDWDPQKYEAVASIASGRHYRVSLVKRNCDGKQCVIRALLRWQDDDAIVRFNDEYQRLRAVQHENVATLIDVAQHPEDRAPYMVQPYYDGGDLSVFKSGLPYKTVLDLAEPICAGLEAVHQAGGVHPMLKPGHIMLDSVKKAVLIDLGSDYHVHDNSTMSIGGALVMNPAYMPPELARGADLTAQSNIYSLSCIFYELLTGSAVFPGDHQMAVAAAHMTAKPRTFSEMQVTLPSTFASTIMSGLEKDPKNRPQSASAFFKALSS